MHTIPGPSAVIAALTLAGLPTDRFLFVGFLPAKAKARADAIAELAGGPRDLGVLRERAAARRHAGALREGLGTREAAVVREISKLHEECVTGPLAELADRYAEKPPKGEIVIVVGPPAERAEASDEELECRARLERSSSLSPSRAAAEVATALNVPRKRAYARALDRSR